MTAVKVHTRVARAILERAVREKATNDQGHAFRFQFSSRDLQDIAGASQPHKAGRAQRKHVCTRSEQLCFFVLGSRQLRQVKVFLFAPCTLWLWLRLWRLLWLVLGIAVLMRTVARHLFCLKSN